MFLICSYTLRWFIESIFMPEPEPQRAQSEAEELEAAVDDALAACGGDLRATVRSLILMNRFLERELETKVSQGFTRGVRHGRFSTYSG